MTWRETIKKACEGVRKAEAERERVLAAAHEAGISTREMAKVAGASHSTVWRWMGGKDKPPNGASLDSEAFDAAALKVIAERITSPDESGLRARGAR